MPKLKTHSGAKKRFKVSGTGKIRHKRRNRRHILTSKTRKRKRQLRRTPVVSPGEVTRLRHMLGL